MIASILFLMIGLAFIAYSTALYVSIKKRLKSNDMGRTNDMDADRVIMRSGHRPYSIRDVKTEELNYN